MEGDVSSLELSVEDFPAGHTAINGRLLVDRAAVALSLYHESPAEVRVRHSIKGDHPAQVHFAPPDPRSAQTLEREKFAEEGAIVFAGLLLQQFEPFRITRTVPRRSRVDYFLGTAAGDEEALLEVSGTMEMRVETVLEEKRRQMDSSPFRKGALRKPGFVAVTRFAPEAVSVLEVQP